MLLREITVRYLPPEQVPAYLEFARAELGEQVVIYLRPQRWLSADLGQAECRRSSPNPCRSGSIPPEPSGWLKSAAGSHN